MNSKDLERLVNVCNYCGSCNYSCPVYEIELTEPYSPRGKINLIRENLKGNIKDNGWITELISVCTICGYCQNSCSKGIDFMRIFKGYMSITDLKE